MPCKTFSYVPRTIWNVTGMAPSSSCITLFFFAPPSVKGDSWSSCRVFLFLFLCLCPILTVILVDCILPFPVECYWIVVFSFLFRFLFFECELVLRKK